MPLRDRGAGGWGAVPKTKAVNEGGEFVLGVKLT